MNVEALANQITAELRQHGTGSRQGHRPSAQGDFGVYMADFRRVVRSFRKRIAEQSGEDVYQLALALLARRIVECRQAAYELIAGHREARESLTIRRLEALGKGNDNWADVDFFCCALAGQAWREGRIPDEAVLRWARSRDLWWRRSAVVATIPLNMKSRGGTGDPKRTLRVCRELVADPEAMVQKAISWALRELAVRDRKAVEEFLGRERDQVSALVKREVERKLKTGKKNR